MDIEIRRAKDREKARRRRERLKALGIKIKRVRVRTPEQRTRSAELARKYRAEAAERGEKLPSDTWHLRNPEKHRERTRQWLAQNPGKAVEYALKWRTQNKERYLHVSREASARRRETRHGKINSAIFCCLHKGVNAKRNRASKYTMALGYSWKELRAHLESQFLPGMTWDNWGDVWELDHIKPLATFKYESLDDPLFEEAWRLSNLRPLWREANASKGCKTG